MGKLVCAQFQSSAVVMTLTEKDIKKFSANIAMQKLYLRFYTSMF